MMTSNHESDLAKTGNKEGFKGGGGRPDCLSLGKVSWHLRFSAQLVRVLLLRTIRRPMLATVWAVVVYTSREAEMSIEVSSCRT
jgi:hypothetical protein